MSPLSNLSVLLLAIASIAAGVAVPESQDYDATATSSSYATESTTSSDYSEYTSATKTHKHDHSTTATSYDTAAQTTMYTTTSSGYASGGSTSSTPTTPTNTSEPPAATQTASDSHGSALCFSIRKKTQKIRETYSQYEDDKIYRMETSRVSHKMIGLTGVAAMFKCSTQVAYDTGMSGRQIKAAFDVLFADEKVRSCGSVDLSNDCSVTMNACSNCKATN